MPFRLSGRILYVAGCTLWVLVVLCTMAQPAHAYVDPGSGLFMFQAASSTFAGLAFLLRKQIRRLFGRLGRNRKETHADNEAR